MFIIHLEDHEENIYSIGSKPAGKPKDAAKYRSQYADHVRKPNVYSKDSKHSHLTMGKAAECLPNPKEFLRKGDGIQSYIRCPPREQEKGPREKKEKEFPNKEEVKEFDDLMKKKADTRNSRNFVQENIKHVLELEPKVPEKKVIVDNKGLSRPTIREGEPVYVHSKNYGKTPPYLRSVIQAQQRIKSISKDQEVSDQPKCKYLNQEERETLLSGLKQNREELQKQFQLLPMLTDTIPKVLKKSKLEKELDALEKDIRLLESHPYIYVYDEENGSSSSQ